LKDLIKHYSSIIGSDPLLVQGPGGNISWKENDTLWIKASGTWLAEANEKEIFIPLSLSHTRQLIKNNVSDLSSACLTISPLRPSIETFLHVLLPQTVVVHIHAVDVIAKAVLTNAKNIFSIALEGLSWAWIDYAKPGPDLANKIAAQISETSAPNILILANHGVVIAGASLNEVNNLLQQVLDRCKEKPRTLKTITQAALKNLSTEWVGLGYHLPSNAALHSLSIDSIAISFVLNHWVMYPDHAVFLGKKAIIKKDKEPPNIFLTQLDNLPSCIFIEKCGVVVSQDFSYVQNAMLNCFLDVVSRISVDATVVSLHEGQISELLNWDAEKFRQKINI
jgi:rhamnose utilization protein RhaD (predicted bifunctional aldolase and dehydrogenase)